MLAALVGVPLFILFKLVCDSRSCGTLRVMLVGELGICLNFGSFSIPVGDVAFVDYCDDGRRGSR